MASQARRQSIDFLRAYQVELEKWKQQVACQCQNERVECFCRKYFVPMDKVLNWMEKSQWPGSKSNNLDGLLHALESKMKELGSYESFSSSATILKDDKRCVKVFATLLDLGSGELIYLFRFHNVIDHILDYPTDLLVKELEKDLKKHGIKDASNLLDNFGNAKWSYCSPPLTQNMERDIESKFIPPFCRRERVNEKGGTASVFQVAVKKEFISDPSLAKVLSKSLYRDKEFGECYQMAVKSFSKNAMDIYTWEKTAFTGLQDVEDVPIVRYLGCFCHDDGSGEPDAVSHNLLLEYGQKDLDEFWADLTNAPPMRTEEIICFWQSLFDIAKALEIVHKVKVREKVFDGWHADVKPDNILLVHGEFKLADFGFARFVERAEDEKGAPEQCIEGGTHAYGAPEVARMKNDGKLAPVKQTIDTWSLGCVYSVAATWVVLGYHGVRQFEMLRKIANGRRTGTADTDRFHDGCDVLPEIKQWHNYLKNLTRVSDTLTHLVLDFVESKMLRKEPEDRSKSGVLYQKLCKLLVHARTEKKILMDRGDVTETSDSVKQALMVTEAASPHVKFLPHSDYPVSHDHIHLDFSEPGSEPGSNTLRVDVNRPAPASRRLGKSEMLSVQLNKAPYREKVLQQETQKNGFSFEVISASPAMPPGVHHGEKTSSPVSLSSSSSEDEHSGMPWKGKSKAERPHAYQDGLRRELEPRAPPLGSPRILTYRSNGSTFPNSPSWRASKGRDARLSGKTDSYAEPMIDMDASSVPSGHLGNTDALQSNQFPEETEPTKPSRKVSTNRRETHPSIQPQYQRKTQYNMATNSEAPENNYEEFSSHPLGAARRSTSPSNPLPIANPPGWHAPVARNTAPVVGHLHTHAETALSARSGSVASGYSENTSAPLRNQFPKHVYDLPWNVCTVRKQLEDQQPHGKWQTFVRFLKSEAKDEHLEQIINGRDLVLVVDNATSMQQYWPIVIFVAETLAMNIGGLDEDGPDLVFTMGTKYNKDKLQGLLGLVYLKKKLREAWPRGEIVSDMSSTLSSLFIKYRKKEKAATFLVLTDGEWDVTTVRNHIIQEAKSQGQHRPDRHLTVQFIRFGIKHKKNLKELDELGSKLGINDIVDHTCWKSDVTKMIVGSVNPNVDNMEDEDELDSPSALDGLASPFGFANVCELFEQFNNHRIPDPPSPKPPSRTPTTSNSSKISPRRRKPSWLGSMESFRHPS